MKIKFKSYGLSQPYVPQSQVSYQLPAAKPVNADARKLSSARTILMIIAISTIIVVALLLFADKLVLLSAIFPIVSLFLLGHDIGLIMTVVCAGFYLLCFFASKKRPGWLSIAFIGFLVDMLLLGVFFLDNFESQMMIPVLYSLFYHITFLCGLGGGIGAGRRMKKAAKEAMKAMKAQQMMYPQPPMQPMTEQQPPQQ